jgi:hypothetical protein
MTGHISAAPGIIRILNIKGAPWAAKSTVPIPQTTKAKANGRPVATYPMKTKRKTYAVI